MDGKEGSEKNLNFSKKDSQKDLRKPISKESNQNNECKTYPELLASKTMEVLLLLST